MATMIAMHLEYLSVFFFNDTATTEIYTLSLHDALPISISTDSVGTKVLVAELLGRYDTLGIDCVAMNANDVLCVGAERSEEHTSELQSRQYLVCRLLLEKKTHNRKHALE